MISNINKTLLIILTLSSATYAGPKLKLLTTSVGKELESRETLTLMTPKGLEEFQNFRNYARKIWSAEYDSQKYKGQKTATSSADGLISDLGSDRSLDVLIPKIGKDGQNTALVQQMKVDGSGTISRSAFEIPATHEKPVSISFTNPMINVSGFNETVRIKRIFDNPFSKNEKIELNNTMTAKQLKDGKVYNVVLDTEVTHGNKVAEATIGGGNYFDSKEIMVRLKVKDPNSNTYNFLSYDSGSFKLPDEIKGEVVQVNINAIGTRLTFKTTEGIEYTYSIQRNESTSGYDTFNFTKISELKIPGGVNSLLADVKLYPGRKSKNPFEAPKDNVAKNPEQGEK